MHMFTKLGVEGGGVRYIKVCVIFSNTTLTRTVASMSSFHE